MSKITLLALTLCVLIVPVGFGQNPNTGTASMRINGRFGSPFPITNVPLPRGLPQNVLVQGVPNAPFVTIATTALATTGVATPYGLLDIDLSSGSAELFNGVNNPLYRTDATGTFNLNVTLPANATVGATAAVQSLIADTTTPTGASLTAASSLLVLQGITVLPITFNGVEPGQLGTAVQLSNYGLSFPFYDTVYTSMYVNADGFVSLSGNTPDFTPSPIEFRTGPSRIAPFWTDLDPSYGGTVTVTIDENPLAAAPTAKIEWSNLAEWQNSGGQHSFSTTLNLVTGDIEISHSAFNSAMVYDQLMGITPGLNKLPPAPNNQWSAQKDLSTLNTNPVFGLPNEAFWEWYGIPGAQMPYYTAGFANPWDMAGTTRHFIGIDVGMIGGRYYGT
ncbi:MAG: hypothetical protein CMJ83_04680 [Planctomycetes bacterium]|nr:hypothetical protein [Planctomycetota bacterium]